MTKKKVTHQINFFSENTFLENTNDLPWKGRIELLKKERESLQKSLNIKKLVHTIRAKLLQSKNEAAIAPIEYLHDLSRNYKHSKTAIEIFTNFKNLSNELSKYPPSENKVQLFKNLLHDLKTEQDNWLKTNQPIFYNYEIGYHYFSNIPAPYPSNVKANDRLISHFEKIQSIEYKILNTISIINAAISFTKKRPRRKNEERILIKSMTVWDIVGPENSDEIITALSIASAYLDDKSILTGKFPNLQFHCPKKNKPGLYVRAFFVHLYNIGMIPSGKYYNASQLTTIFLNTFPKFKITFSGLRKHLGYLENEVNAPEFHKCFSLLKA